MPRPSVDKPHLWLGVGVGVGLGSGLALLASPPVGTPHPLPRLSCLKNPPVVPAPSSPGQGFGLGFGLGLGLELVLTVNVARVPRSVLLLVPPG
eukprot:scaffold57094_cov46-Phaeocystis_antarctica.AAC.1